jgi:hypothetical protein
VPCFHINTLWRDAHYYRHPETGSFMPKYVLILAVSPDAGDALTAVMTSKPNGLREDPPCQLGNPRAGYFLGIPGQPLCKPTWVDFNSLVVQDILDFQERGRHYIVTAEPLQLPAPVFCSLLRCVAQSEDLSRRHHDWVLNALDHLRG